MSDENEMRRIEEAIDDLRRTVEVLSLMIIASMIILTGMIISVLEYNYSRLGTGPFITIGGSFFMFYISKKSQFIESIRDRRTNRF